MTFLGRVTRMSRPVKRLMQVAIDCALIVLCFVTAMLLRLESGAFASDPWVWAVLAPVLPVTLAAFIKLGLYRAVIRYITGRALRVVFLGVALSGVAMSASAIVLNLPIPVSVPVIYAVLLFVSVGGIRFLVRAMFLHSKIRHRQPILIYGAGSAGRQLAKALHQGVEYDPVAFVDDDRALHGSIVAGLRVLPPAHLPELIVKSRAQAILLALPTISRARRREVVSALEPLKIEVKILPGMADIVSGKAQFSDLRTISAEDLLGRDAIEPRADLMAAHTLGKVVLVSGAGGSIGAELCRQILAQSPRMLVLLEVSEFALYQIEQELQQLQVSGTGSDSKIVPVLGSVQHVNRMRAVLTAYGVQTIYHAAAFKHVPLVEQNIVEGVRNNVFGTQVLAQAALATGVENFILISTDKAVRPSSVMGATKRLAEIICQSMGRSQTGTVFSMVRFGNVLGSSGSVIPLFQDQIRRGGPVTVTHREITRYFMTIAEAAQLVIQAGAMARGGDVFVLDMGEPVRIFDLARTMIRLHGLEPYVMHSGRDRPDAGRADIGIHVTGLRKGEKLHEELLIGNNPTGTDHPRIMSASEDAMEPAELDDYLVRLMQCCLDSDVAAVLALLSSAPLGYTPGEGEISDLSWQGARVRWNPQGQPALRLIDGARKV